MIDHIKTALSRRRMLLGLAVSATAATVGDASSGSRENPDLVALADALPAVVVDYISARDTVRAIVVKWSPQWPVPSEDIISYALPSKDYRDIEGHGLEMPWGKGGMKRMPQLGVPEAFEESAERYEADAARCAHFKSPGKMQRNLRWAERERARIEPARAYWSEVERITTASGIEAAHARKASALDAVRSAVDEIMDADDWTIAGAVIKAQALNAWAEVEEPDRAVNVRGAVWADNLAASIVRHAGAQG